jgi:hypothetical protein
MNAAQQELFDLAILRVLVANHTRFGLSAAAVVHLLPQFGFPNPGDALVLDRIEYLVSKGLAEEVLKQVSKTNRAWRASDKGRQYEDEH